MLADDTGKIIQQVFFYGDKDGKESYESFLTSFPTTDWKSHTKNTMDGN
ncbi:MAG: hypothetical protein WKF59_10300 [Chitinophagaceae bacterium]